MNEEARHDLLRAVACSFRERTSPFYESTTENHTRRAELMTVWHTLYLFGECDEEMELLALHRLHRPGLSQAGMAGSR